MNAPVATPKRILLEFLIAIAFIFTCTTLFAGCSNSKSSSNDGGFDVKVSTTDGSTDTKVSDGSPADSKVSDGLPADGGTTSSPDGGFTILDSGFSQDLKSVEVCGYGASAQSANGMTITEWWTEPNFVACCPPGTDCSKIYSPTNEYCDCKASPPRDFFTTCKTTVTGDVPAKTVSQCDQ